MKVVFIVVLALSAVVTAAPKRVREPLPQIVVANSQKGPEGNYKFDFQSENGISRQEVGEVKEVIGLDEKPHKIVAVKGSVKYLTKEGKELVLTYYADETGYHAEGPSIPKSNRR